MASDGHTSNQPRLERIAVKNTLYSTCEVELGWSGGPVVLESSGELIGFTKFKNEGFLLDFTGVKKSPETHGFTYVGKVKEMIDYFLEGRE